jgi:hypothetical protein
MIAAILEKKQMMDFVITIMKCNKFSRVVQVVTKIVARE